MPVRPPVAAVEQREAASTAGGRYATQRSLRQLLRELGGGWDIASGPRSTASAQTIVQPALEPPLLDDRAQRLSGLAVLAILLGVEPGKMRTEDLGLVIALDPRRSGIPTGDDSLGFGTLHGLFWIC